MDRKLGSSWKNLRKKNAPLSPTKWMEVSGAVYLLKYLLEIVSIKVVSKYQITPKSKAWADEKAQHTSVCEHFEKAHNTAIGC